MIIPIACRWEGEAGGAVPPRLPEWIIFDMQGNVVPAAGGAGGGAASLADGSGASDTSFAAATAAAVATATLDGVTLGVLTLKEKVRNLRWVPYFSKTMMNKESYPHSAPPTPFPPPSPPQDGSKVVLQVGNHRVNGELETLGKPLLLIEKHRLPAVSAAAASEGGAAAEAPTTSDVPPPASGAVEYLARAVIRRKLVFRDRPQPIVGAAAAAAGGSGAS